MLCVEFSFYIKEYQYRILYLDFVYRKHMVFYRQSIFAVEIRYLHTKTKLA